MGVEDEDDADKNSDEDDVALPFACFICRETFVHPVVTKCKHYFCEHCALKHHTKNKKCFVCNQPTMRIFDGAHEIKKREWLKNGVKRKDCEVASSQAKTKHYSSVLKGRTCLQS